MHGTDAVLRPAGRLSGPRAPAELDPAWRPWVRLLEIALESADDPGWQSATPSRLALPAAYGSATDAPLLDGATLRVDARRVRRLVRDLVRAAAEGSETGASLTSLKPRRLDAIALVQAAIVGDADAIERMAAESAADAGALHVVAQLAVLPLLHACSKRLRELVPSAWQKGYCPICGAWATLAELRGLERQRYLRCGRCACAWVAPVLLCPYCEENRHASLAYLLPEGEDQTRRVDVCTTCNGYVKTLTTLRELPLRALLLDDLASVEFDVIAHERGYSRPPGQGYPIDVTVERAERAPRSGAAAPGM